MSDHYPRHEIKADQAADGSNGFVSQNNPRICTIIQIQEPDLHDDTWRRISAPCRVGFHTGEATSCDPRDICIIMQVWL